MKKINRLLGHIAVATISLSFSVAPLVAQQRIKEYPGYERYAKMSKEIPGSVKEGVVSGVSWSENERSLEYDWDGKRYRFDIKSGSKAAIPSGTAPNQQREDSRQPLATPCPPPERARQSVCALSGDSKLLAFYRDRNLWIKDMSGGKEYPITTDGSTAARTKFGTGTWVYGEELDQNTAMWWSPDGSKLAFYGFDESQVKDFFVLKDQVKIQDKVDVEAYPKTGASNPIVDVFVYDLVSKKTTRVDIRTGRPFENDAVGYYAYNVQWTPDGTELLMLRSNRRQNVLELTACNPVSGSCRSVVREEWPSSWIDNHPAMKFLSDGRRFIWESERTGYKHYYLYDLTGKLHATLTKGSFEVGRIARLDEKTNALWYTARDGDNYMKVQLHRVGLNGRGDKRLTDPAFHHSCTISPSGKYFIDVAQAHDIPPMTQLVSGDGKVVAELARSDVSKFQSLHLNKVEMFKFTAADGKTELHGMLHFPSNFDPSKKYPVLLSVYSGPATNGATEDFSLPSSLTEYGFLYLRLDARSAAGRGKRFLDNIYMKLGVTEIDDLAAGVKSLWTRPYVDQSRVGIFGTSYGGYASIMALARYPEVFSAAVASSAVTDWRHYDTIYTERYMWTPEGNREGYDAGSALTYVKGLKGRLMIFYGTADDNVHPNNSLQLIQALQRAGKSFEVQVGPDAGHASLNRERTMEFFLENLKMKLVPAAE